MDDAYTRISLAYLRSLTAKLQNLLLQEYLPKDQAGLGLQMTSFSQHN